MIDSGVNYLLPEIRNRLAVDSNGQLIGFDFWDMDGLPFDAHPVGQGFELQRHGTRTASLLLREAPNIDLVAYRYPRPDMSRMKDLVEHAAENDVSIIGMPLGGSRREDWLAFEEAANAHPKILFIVSAGNNGRDIDVEPIYPAALSLANMLVVTSSEDFVRPAERTNWGEQSVDFLLPAEGVVLLDFDGYDVTASGSSYAVSRLTALAARISQEYPEWDASELIQALRTRYNSGGEGWVSEGYIADPLVTNENDHGHSNVTVQSSPRLPPTEKENQYELSLDVLVLDPSWNTERINNIASTVHRVFNQCGIGLVSPTVWLFKGPDYLQDLSTGTAQTVMNAARKKTGKPLVVLARDTRMNEQYTGEAFGLGNTRSRPWLRYSVWLTEDVEDEGLAMAHEVYHIIANSGEHRLDAGNLMQSDTNPDYQLLTSEQCNQAIEFGLKKELLRPVGQ